MLATVRYYKTACDGTLGFAVGCLTEDAQVDAVNLERLGTEAWPCEGSLQVSTST